MTGIAEAAMQHINLILISLALLSMSISLAHDEDQPFQRRSCIATLAHRFFRMNSTVAVIETIRLQPISVKLEPHFLEENPVQLMSHNMFSFLVMRLKVNKWNDCVCSYARADHKAVDYFVLVGNGKDIVSCLEAYCFGRLTNDRSQFVVYLDDGTKNATEKVENILELLWTHQQPRVVVLAKNAEENMDVYTWFPFDSKPEVKLIDTCDSKSLR